jgi:phosphoglycerate dehydrogenase-like enzyme
MSESAYAAVLPEPERSVIHQLLDVVEVVHHRDLGTRSDWSGVKYLVTSWGAPLLDAKFLARMPALEVVFHAAGTVKSIATDAMWKRGIRVTTAAQANARPVAEYTCAQIILALKRVWPRALAWREDRHYQHSDPLATGAHNRTIGLLALSRTGRLVRELLRSYDLQVLAYDPMVTADEAAALGVGLVSLDRIFAESQVVSCHLPMLKNTTGLLRARHFAAMRPGATFINTARAGVLRSNDLLRVLKERPDLWALLDVTDPEPPVDDTLLLSLPNVILTPHLAGSQGEECRRLGRMIIAEIRRDLQSLPLDHEVKRQQMSAIA